MDDSRQRSERLTRELIARYGCQLVRYGRAWRIVGPQVDLLVSDLRSINVHDFPAPQRPSPRG